MNVDRFLHLLENMPQGLSQSDSLDEQANQLAIQLEQKGMIIFVASWECHSNIYFEYLVGPRGCHRKWGLCNRPYEETGAWSLGYGFDDEATCEYNAGRLGKRACQGRVERADEFDIQLFSPAFQAAVVKRLQSILDGSANERFIEDFRCDK